MGAENFLEGFLGAIGQAMSGLAGGQINQKLSDQQFKRKQLMALGIDPDLVEGDANYMKPNAVLLNAMGEATRAKYGGLGFMPGPGGFPITVNKPSGGGQPTATVQPTEVSPSASAGVVGSGRFGVLYDPQDGDEMYPKTAADRQDLLDKGALTTRP